MKFKAMLLGLSVITALPAFAQKPVYLDTGKPIEERVKDALNRMTLEEKVKMIHAQSKFSSAGVPRLGIPEVWATLSPFTSSVNSPSMFVEVPVRVPLTTTLAPGIGSPCVSVTRPRIRFSRFSD